jgi:transcriptional regulator with PAS, ATPase and Fis domain
MNEEARNSESTILSNWLQEIESNPRFSNEKLLQNINLESYSKTFLSKLLQTIHTKDISTLSKKMFEPLLDLWHQLNQDQINQGFSTKETAVLVYALKTSLLKQSENFSETEKAQLEQLELLLDLLGMLIFEMYTTEKEKVISKQEEQIHYLQSIPHSDSNIIGNSKAMKDVFKAIGLVLENDVTVLLEGESGTGKDVIATSIHQNSNRKNKPFIALNCGAIPKELIESELFGHEKGSFTGADERKIGKFELADQGTLFLDEIGEMPIELQVKLLRVLQNKEVERIGGSHPIPINTRIIAATNKNLKQLVDAGKFRLDLFYRLNVYPIRIPSLKERPEDILPLAQHFIDKYNQHFNVKSGPLTKDAETFLLNQKWEGNIRELENLIQRTVLLAQSSPITSITLEMKPGGSESTPLLESGHTPTPFGDTVEPLEDIERKAIEHAIQIKKGNLQQVAKALGISRTTLYNKLEKYGLKS